MTKTAVVYARISIATEESVSVARQIASGRKYAAARGWKVVGEFVDEGVSATRFRPHDRPGWRSLLASAEAFDAVVIWKVDRLARRVTDFLAAHESLLAQDAAIVCVEQSIDMTTGEGRAFAQMLAVFGELEAATLSSRSTAARAHVLATGRSPGGLQPYGWRNIPNPHGPGRVRAQDPERIEWVREMVTRALRGDTVYSIVRWLNTAGAPAPTGRKSGRTWGYSTVDRLLRNPVLAGMTPCNPGNPGGGHRGPGLLRDEDGHPVISEDVALISVAEHEALVHALTNKSHHAAVSRNLRRRTSPLLAQFVTCAGCDILLHRHQHRGGKLLLRCRGCGQMVSSHLLVAYLEHRLLTERGSRPMYRRTIVVPGDSATTMKLASIDHELGRAAAALTAETADTFAIGEEIAQLKRARANARKAAASRPVDVLQKLDKSVADVWQLCTSDEQRREILEAQIDVLTVARGRAGGRGLDQRRVTLEWRHVKKSVVPNGISLDAVHADLRQPSPWISQADAIRLTGLTETTIRNAVAQGHIERRHVAPSYPSLSRISVMEFASSRRSAR